LAILRVELNLGSIPLKIQKCFFSDIWVISHQNPSVMKKQKSGGSFRAKGETIVAKAIRMERGFGYTYRKFEQQTTLEQGSISALQN
jgi:hypothetical protein